MRDCSGHEKQHGERGSTMTAPHCRTSWRKTPLPSTNGDEKWEHRAEVLESAKRFVTGGGKVIHLSFPHLEIQSFGDVAILYSLWTTDTEAHGQHSVSSGRATEIFLRCNAQWLNVGCHLDSGK
jgi:SnoaL-like domain